MNLASLEIQKSYRQCTVGCPDINTAHSQVSTVILILVNFHWRGWKIVMLCILSYNQVKDYSCIILQIVLAKLGRLESMSKVAKNWLALFFSSFSNFQLCSFSYQLFFVVIFCFFLHFFLQIPPPILITSPYFRFFENMPGKNNPIQKNYLVSVLFNPLQDSTKYNYLINL